MSKVEWYGHVLRKGNDDVSRTTLNFEKGERKRVPVTKDKMKKANGTTY